MTVLDYQKIDPKILESELSNPRRLNDPIEIGNRFHCLFLLMDELSEIDRMPSRVVNDELISPMNNLIEYIIRRYHSKMNKVQIFGKPYVLQASIIPDRGPEHPRKMALWGNSRDDLVKAGKDMAKFLFSMGFSSVSYKKIDEFSSLTTGFNLESFDDEFERVSKKEFASINDAIIYICEQTNTFSPELLRIFTMDHALDRAIGYFNSLGTDYGSSNRQGDDIVSMHDQFLKREVDLLSLASLFNKKPCVCHLEKMIAGNLHQAVIEQTSHLISDLKRNCNEKNQIIGDALLATLLLAMAYRNARDAIYTKLGTMAAESIRYVALPDETIEFAQVDIDSFHLINKTEGNHSFSGVTIGGAIEIIKELNLTAFYRYEDMHSGGTFVLISSQLNFVSISIQPNIVDVTENHDDESAFIASERINRAFSMKDTLIWKKMKSRENMKADPRC